MLLRPNPVALAALAGVLLLSGCVQPGPVRPLVQLKLLETLDLSRLQATLPPLVAAAPVPPPDWWTGFKDPQLNQLIGSTLQQSPNLGMVLARAERAKGLAQAAGAQLKPAVNASGELPYLRGSKNSTYIPRFAGQWEWQPAAGILVNWELDFWGKNRAALSAAISNAQASALEADDARLQLVASQVKLYLQFDLAHQQSRWATERLQVVQRQIQLNTLRLEAGLDMEGDVLRLQGEYATLQQQLSQLRGLAANLALQMAELAGEGPQYAAQLRPPTLSAAQFGLPPQLQSDLLSHRADLAAAKARAEAAGYEVAGAQAQFYPSINLAAFAGLASYGLDRFAQLSSLQAGIKPAITLPLLDAPRLRGQLAVAEAEQDAARYSYNATLLHALREVAAALEDINALNAEAQALNQQQTIIDKGLHIAQQRREQGLSSELPGLALRLQWLGLQANKAQLQQKNYAAQAELARATGGGWRPALP